MELSVYNRTNKDMAYILPLYEKIAASAERKLRLKKNQTLSVTFVRSRTIHVINRDYRGIDRPTDETEGDYIEEELGDIFINIDYAKRQAAQYGHSYEREVCFLFTHGLLHCLGYDHMNPKDEAEMFSLQDRILDPIIGRDQ